MNHTTRIAQASGILLVLGLLAGPGVATAQPALIAPDLLSAEINDLRPARAALDKFDSQLKTLEAKQRFTAAEIEALRQQAEEVKRFVPVIQRSLGSIITKIKSAGKWTTEFDAWVADLVRRSGRNDIVIGLSEANGARAALQRTLTEIMQVPPDLDGIVSRFKASTTFDRLVEPVLGTPVSAAGSSKLLELMGMVVRLLTQCIGGPCV